jgi:hypothetical protein
MITRNPHRWEQYRWNESPSWILWMWWWGPIESFHEWRPADGVEGGW